MNWSLWTGGLFTVTVGLYIEVVYLAFLDGRNLKWSLLDGCY